MAEQASKLQQKAYPSAMGTSGLLVDTSPEVQGRPETVAAFGVASSLPLADISAVKTTSPSSLKPEARILPLGEEDAKDVFGPSEEVQEPAPLTTALPLLEVARPSSSRGMQQASYPSASPETTNIPSKGYKRKPSIFRPNVRDSIKSFMSADQSLTVPIKGLARVAQRQFTMAANLNRDQFVQEQEEAREVLNFTVRLAETMFHYGADTMDVDSAIMAVCSTYGLDDVEVDVTNQSIIINYVSDIRVDREKKSLASSFGARTNERFSHTVIKVVRSNSENYFALQQTYNLIHSITEMGMNRLEAEQELQAINSRKKLYSPASILGFNLLMAIAFTFGVGGSWRAAVVAFLVFIAVHFSMQWAGKLRLPSFFSMAVGSGVITAAAMLVSNEASLTENLGFYVSGPHVVAAGLIMLLPTARLVSAVQDALTGYPLTAAGKFVTAGMGFIGLVVGIAVSLAVMNYFDAASMDIQQAVFNPPPVWVNVTGMLVGSLTVAAAAQGTWRNMLWVVLVSLVGQGVYYGMSMLAHEEPGKLNVALGAMTVGALSAVLAFKLHAPQSIFAIPGVMFLLPGLTLFRGLYGLVIDPDPVAGISNMLNASATLLALSAGVVLGIYLTQYILQYRMEKKNPPEAGTETKTMKAISLDTINR